jgi:FkbM family methyltransferase
MNVRMNLTLHEQLGRLVDGARRRKQRLSGFFDQSNREKRRILKLPRYTEGSIALGEKKFVFHDSLSFLDSYREIFENGIYEFTPHPKKKMILDCGANIGVSVLYLSLNYPDHTIVAFEPDPKLFDILTANVAAFGLSNVTLMNKAVWNKPDLLPFFTDGGLGGRLLTAYEKQTPKQVEAVRLRDFITDEIGFLKVDIEGAEYEVLVDCDDRLAVVDKLFFEYHGPETRRQTLHELLQILQRNNFHYYVKESVTRVKPFVDHEMICEVFDMALNVFGYHPAAQ